MNGDERIIIGSEEWCVFPSLHVPAIKARVDSGAKTSALHAFNIQPFERDGQDWVSFQVHPLQSDRQIAVSCQAPVVGRRTVKSSSGSAEKRYVIRTDIELGDYYWEVELTLSNRDSMGYRMLLGREAMLGRMLVDPGESFLAGYFSPEELTAFYGESRPGSGLKIGLLASDPGLYSNRRIMEAGSARGHEMVFLNLQQCYVKLDADSPELHYLGGHQLGDFDAVIPRVRPKVTFYGCALTRHFAALGIYPLNSADAIQCSRDKLSSLQALQAADVPIPTSAFANAPVEVGDLIAMVDGPPLVITALEGPSAAAPRLAEDRDTAQQMIAETAAAGANLLVQQHVNGSGKRRRLLVVDGKVRASLELSGAIGNPRRRRARVIRAGEEERQLALRAARAIRLSVAGVDLVQSPDGPLVVNVTAVPSLEEAERLSNKDIAGRLVKTVERLLGWELRTGKKASR